jgi:uncharacterized Tic20 family protein
MPIAVICPSCKAKLKAPDTLNGKTVKCPGCAKPVTVKASVAPPPAPPPPAPRKPAPSPEVIEDPVEAPEDEAAAPPAPGGPTTDKERSTAMWIHLLPLVLFCCGGIGAFISLYFWLSGRKESAFIDHHGKTWLNFIINLFVLLFAVLLVFGALSVVALYLGNTAQIISFGLFGLIVVALNVYVFVRCILAGLKAKKGEWFEYRVLFKVLK